MHERHHQDLKEGQAPMMRLTLQRFAATSYQYGLPLERLQEASPGGQCPVHANVQLGLVASDLKPQAHLVGSGHHHMQSTLSWLPLSTPPPSKTLKWLPVSITYRESPAPASHLIASVHLIQKVQGGQALRWLWGGFVVGWQCIQGLLHGALKVGAAL